MWLVLPALPAAIWQLLLLTDTFDGSLPTRTVDFVCAKVSARRGDLSRRCFASGRRLWYSIAILGGVQFDPQAQQQCGVACRCSECSGWWLWGAGVDSSLLLHEIDHGVHCLLVVAIKRQQLEYKLYRPKLARFSDNIITLAVNGLLYPYLCKNRNWEKPKPRLSVRNRPKLNWKWNSRTVTALLASQHSSQSCSISGEIWFFCTEAFLPIGGFLRMLSPRCTLLFVLCYVMSVKQR